MTISVMTDSKRPLFQPKEYDDKICKKKKNFFFKLPPKGLNSESSNFTREIRGGTNVWNKPIKEKRM